MRYYVFCATDLSDSLGMWNYYVKGDNYQGYNLCLSINDFIHCFQPIKNPDVDIFYGNVIYKEQEKIDIIRNAILKIDNDLFKLNSEITDYDEYDIARQAAQGELLAYLENYRLFFKDSSFSAEKEYRFIVRLPIHFNNTENNVLKTGYTIKNGILTPYCEIKIDSENTISGITLSPMLEIDLAENGLKRYLNYNGYNSKVTIQQSKIPIRY